MKQTKRSDYRLGQRQRQTQKPVLKIVAAGSLIVAVFAAAFIYLNVGFNKQSLAGISYTWTGTASSNWSNSSNWSPSGVPGAGDNVTIAGGANNVVLPASVSVNNITVNTGAIINLNGFTLTSNGVSAFNNGTISNSGSTGSLIAQGTITSFGSGASGPTIAPDVTVNSGTITIANTTFNNTAGFTKTGSTNDGSAGNNTYNGAATFTISGSGYLLMSNNTRDIFNADVTLSGTGTGNIYVAYSGINTQFNQNIIVNSTSTGGVRIGANGGTSTLAAGKTINVGSLGVSNGLVSLGGFTTGTNQSLTFTGNCVLQLGPNSTFNGDVVATCGGIALSGATFNGVANFTKTGATNDAGTGNNTFNGTTTISSSGTGYMILSNSTRDIFNTDATFTSTGSGIIYVAYSGINTQFNQNIIVNSTSTGGVRIGANGGTSTLVAGKTINVGSLGVSNGLVSLGGFTTATNQSLTFTGNGVLQLGPNSTFNGDVVATCGGIALSGATFNGVANFTKTGATNDAGTGNNTFNGTTTISSSGTGYMILSNSTRDIFNTDATFTSTGSGIIYVAYSGINTQFNQNIIVNSTSTGGVRIGANGGTSTLAAGKTINVGSLGVSNGLVSLGGFTTGTNQSLTFTGNGVLQLGPNSTFNGDVVVTCGGIALSGATFNGVANFTKTGATNDAGTGNNTFNGTTTISSSGTGYMILSNSTRDVFNTDATFTSTGSGIIYVAYSGINTQFNQNIIVNSTSTGGVRIGANGGTSTLAAGKTVNVGTLGVSNGLVSLGGFTTGTNQSLTFTGNGVLQLGPNSTFNGDVVATCGGIALSGATFNGVANFTKTGATNDAGTGNNTFNGTTTISSSGTGYMILSNSTRDVFNTDATFTSTGAGIIYVAYSGTNTQFNQNIIINSTSTGGVRTGANGGTSTLATGKTVNTGSPGVSNGLIMLGGFTTATNQSLTFTGNGVLQLGPNSTFNGDVVATCGGIALSGATFNGIANFTKTGATNDAGTGNNTFNGTTTISNSGTGYIILSNSTRDIFNTDATFTSTGSGIIYVAFSDAVGTQFNSNIILNSTSNGSIRFGQNGGASTLANGKTISIGGSGFTGGDLYLRNFTQTGTTAQAINLASGTGALYLQTGSVFNGAVNFVFPQLYLNGTTFNNTSFLQKNGATANISSGGSVFNAATTIKNSGTGILYLANTTSDDFNGNATFIQTGSGALYPAYNVNTTFSGDISTAGTTTAITFGNAAGTVTLDGSVLQNINGSSSFAPIIRRLSVNNGTNGITLNVPVTVSLSLSLVNSNINTSSANLLTMSSGSSVSGVSDGAFVNGPVRKVGNQAFTFPTGKGGYYRPVSITAPASATDHFTAEYFFTDPNPLYNVNSHDLTLNSLSRVEYWDLSRTNGASNVTVTLSWNSQSGIGNVNALRVTRWDIPATKWKDLGNGSTTGNSSAGTITSSAAVTIFGGFTLGSTFNALPVELISFNVSLENKSALVKWETASEINNDFFTVERSPDRQHFKTVGTVHGAGSTSTLQSYSLVDPEPLPAVSYYRLSQTDFNGHIENFNPVVLHNDNTVGDLKLNTTGPNPFSDEFNVDFNSSSESPVTITVINVAGAIVFEDKTKPSSGSNLFRVRNMAHLPDGIYFLQLTQGDIRTVPYKLVKKQ